MELVTVRRFDNYAEAHIFKSRLESEGVTCFLFDENIVSLNPLYNQTVWGIKLKVPQSEVFRAKEILNEVYGSEITDENGAAIQCPKCGSTRLYAGFKSVKGPGAIVVFLISLLSMLYPPYFKSRYCCKDCGTAFDMNENRAG